MIGTIRRIAPRTPANSRYRRRRRILVPQVLLLILASFATTNALKAQDAGERHVAGDSTLKHVMAPQVRAIYDRQSQWVFGLTRENIVRIEGATATEFRAAQAEGSFHRIIATVWTTQGKYAAEYYLSDDTPIYVYEAFEYFEEAAPIEAWRNFKGLPGWERRSYLNDNAVGYIESSGRPSFNSDAMRFQHTINRFFTALAQRR